MIFVMDVGNTNIKCGMFQGNVLVHSFRMTTDIDATSDQYGIQMIDFFSYLEHTPMDIEGIIVSSVIPSLNYTLDHMSREYFKKKPMFVGPGIKTGINIKYDNPKELGTDRIVNAVGAYELFGGRSSPSISVRRRVSGRFLRKGISLAERSARPADRVRCAHGKHGQAPADRAQTPGDGD